MTYSKRVWLLVGLTVIVGGLMTFLPPTPQSLTYHNFADQRSYLGLRNFLDVTSNLSFLIVGIMGLCGLGRYQKRKRHIEFIEHSEQWPFWLLFIGVTLTCFGSAYYHLEPNNARLVWDRLPMTVIFMSFFSSIIMERINVKAGLISLFPLVSLGVFSVLFWHWSELRGEGDLRLYILVQFYPMLAIPLILLLFPARYTRSTDLFFVFFFYGMAKFFEILDLKIYESVRIVSGRYFKFSHTRPLSFYTASCLSRYDHRSYRSSPCPQELGGIGSRISTVSSFRNLSCPFGGEGISPKVRC